MHEAIRCTTVINAPGLRLEAAEFCSESCILATTSDGTLLSLKPDARAAPGSPWQVLNAVKSFSRKTITCLRYLRVHGYILTQADDGVGLFQLASLEGGGLNSSPSLKLIPKTKNPACFCVNKQETLLCVCTKKKLLIFQWFEGEFTELQEFPISETIKRVEWCGEYIIVAQKKEYQLFNLSSGAYTEVIPTGKSTQSPKILQLPYNELLLLKDNVGVFVGLDGKLTRKFGVSWSEQPAHMQVISPYAIAVLKNLIEVRSLHRESSHAVVQTISLKNVSFCSSSSHSGKGNLLLGSQSSIHMLSCVPLLEQIQQLGKSGEFEEALRLCDSMSDEDHVWRITKSGLHQRYGWALFARKMYTEAIRQFSLSSKSPRHVLRLYPSLLPEAARVAVQSLPKLVVLKDCRYPDRSEVSDVPAFKALLPYLLQQRRKILEFCKEKRDSNRRSSFGVLENNDGLIEDAVEEGWGGIDLIQLVDTGLLHCFLVLEDWDQMLKFLQEKNNVDIAEAEQVLQKKGHYIELILLYRQLERHHEALGMLKSLVIRPDTFQVPPHESTINNLKGTNASIEYLLYLDDQHEDLVLEHSKWIVQYDPQGAFRIFTYRYPSLSSEKVLEHLKDYAPGLRIKYLEFLISKEGGDLKGLQDKLIILLLDEVVSRLGADGRAGGEGQDAKEEVAGYRERLQSLLATSEGFSPEWLLSQLPEGHMLEERALLLRRLGKHREALGIYIHGLGSEDLALRYCEGVYQSAAGGNGKLLSGDGGGPGAGGLSQSPGDGDLNVYLDLMRILLESGEGEGRMGRILDLMTERCDRIDLVQVLGILPEATPLYELIEYLKASFSHSLQERKKMSILKSLTKQEALQVRSELINHQKQSVVVHPESVCKFCYKRVQNSVFVVDKDDGRLIHFVCHRRKEQQKGGGGGGGGGLGEGK
ncbi:vacuolar sorting protein [Chloropicon primus]|nr:vacuolar sorting protein [Chloropicon primus]